MDLEATTQNFSEIIKAYSALFNESRVLEVVVPRAVSNENDLHSFTNNLQYTKNNNDLRGLTTGLSQPIWDLLDRGGIILAECFGRKFQDVQEIAALCEIVHNGTLIVDDIEDSSYVRRGKSCVHLIYGVDISVNAGNFMYFAPLQNLLKQTQKYSPETRLRFSEIYAEEMTVLHVGQCWDIVWHNTEIRTDTIPTVERYLQMTAHKTGVLARLSVRLVCAALALSLEQESKLSTFAEKLGVAFQIQDDILNLEGEEYEATKGQQGEDIHEGKMSLMVIHALTNLEEQDKAKLTTILRLKTTDQQLIREAIGLIKKCGSIDYARKIAQQLINDVWNGDIQQILPEGRHKQLLKLFAEYTIGRQI